MKKTDSPYVVQSLYNFATKLRHIRYDAKLTQIQLSQISNLSVTYIRRLEGQEQIPSIKTLFILAEALKTNPQNFF